MHRGFCNNALITKMRAINCKRLGPSDYEELLKKSYVSDVVNYLKGTHFAEALQGVDAGTAKCEELEELFKEAQFAEQERLLCYVGKGSPNFFSLFWVRLEIKELLLALELFKAGRVEKFAIVHSARLMQKLKLDVLEILNAHTADDFLRAIKSTEYAAILWPELEGKTREEIDILRCENKLATHLFSRAKAEVEKSGKEAKEELRRKFLKTADSYNLRVIYRLKRYYGYSAEKITPLLLPFGNLAGTSKSRQKLCARIADDYLSLFEGGKGSFKPDDGALLEVSIKQKQKAEAERGLKMARYAPLAFWNFCEIANLEVGNLTSIVEGIFNKCGAKEIKKVLIY